MNISELKDPVKLNVLDKEINFVELVKGMKILEWSMIVSQQIMELIFHGTKPSAMPDVVELSSKMCSLVTVIK